MDNEGPCQASCLLVVVEDDGNMKICHHQETTDGVCCEKPTGDHSIRSMHRRKYSQAPCDL
jgi:hypothetical protein